MNQILIRIEGFVVLALSAYFYLSSGYSWGLFLLLLLFPDIFMLGYAFNKKVGAYVYNLAHTFPIPLLLLLPGLAYSIDVLIMIGFIWTAHIGMDRMVGYGLKYETEFKETHIQRL
ncbi:DUF4260 domain-containing protein [Paenibacillus sp. FSL R7-0333]|uniref:DUF4260 domain-containing protein n=1 Tax=Paenibacillus sp. FSL R7-0333 TaxID=1926587 RepID=UPI00096F3DFC|nr:hypothetical protein BK146_22330 [Paenibacillus sp. FSL R7-0333]